MRTAPPAALAVAAAMLVVAAAAKVRAERRAQPINQHNQQKELEKYNFRTIIQRNLPDLYIIFTYMSVYLLITRHSEIEISEE